MEIRPASPRDFDSAYGLLSERAEWLRARSIAQWQSLYPAAAFRRDIDAGEVIVAFVVDACAATMTLTKTKDAYWGESEPHALYLHRLAVALAHSGQGIGARMLEWAERECARRGFPVLRLDCIATNSKMTGYYVARGFARLGTGIEAGVYYALFEKRGGTPT